MNIIIELYNAQENNSHFLYTYLLKIYVFNLASIHVIFYCVIRDEGDDFWSSHTCNIPDFP